MGALPRRASLKQLYDVYKKTKKTQPKIKLKNYPNGYVEKPILDGPVLSYEDYMEEIKKPR